MPMLGAIRRASPVTMEVSVIIQVSREGHSLL